MKNAEYQGNLSCPQRDNAEHEGYAGAQSVGSQEGMEQDGADLLERILSRDNLNRAYKRVKSNKGAPGIDGMGVVDFCGSCSIVQSYPRLFRKQSIRCK